MALDLQQRATQHGHRRHNPRYETENSRLSSTAGPHQKWGDYRFSNTKKVPPLAFILRGEFGVVHMSYVNQAAKSPLIRIHSRAKINCFFVSAMTSSISHLKREFISDSHLTKQSTINGSNCCPRSDKI